MTSYQARDAKNEDVYVFTMYDGVLEINGDPVINMDEFDARDILGNREFHIETLQNFGDNSFSISLSAEDTAQLERIANNASGVTFINQEPASEDNIIDFSTDVYNGNPVSISITESAEILVNGESVTLAEIGQNGTTNSFSYYALDEEGELLKGPDGNPMEIIISYGDVGMMNFALNGENDVVSSSNDAALRDIEADRLRQATAEQTGFDVQKSVTLEP